MYQPPSNTYINICPHSASYIPKSSSSFPSTFATNISYPFHISLNKQFPTQFSCHILSKVSQQSFHIAAMIQNSQSCVLSVVSRLNYLYLYLITNINTAHSSKRPHSGHVTCEHAILTQNPLSTVRQK